MKKSIKLIILDRDGVINYDSVAYIKSVAEWNPIPGSIEAIAELSKNGFQIAIASNQSAIARNYLTVSTLEAIHKKLVAMVANFGGKISQIKYCPHHPDANCFCRKPKPGMLLQILQATSINNSQAMMVGDSLTDIKAAIAANCMAVALRSGKQDSYFKKKYIKNNTIIIDNTKVKIFDNLRQLTNMILTEKNHSY